MGTIWQLELDLNAYHENPWGDVLFPHASIVSYCEIGLGLECDTADSKTVVAIVGVGRIDLIGTGVEVEVVSVGVTAHDRRPIVTTLASVVDVAGVVGVSVDAPGTDKDRLVYRNFF